jgi:hypothetical protein
MSGYPQFNFPAFLAAAHDLRNEGWDIVSPAEMDSEAVQQEALASDDGVLVGGKIAGETWGEILSRDVRVVADDVKGIVFLPNWEKSRGARLEAFVGLLCGHKFVEYKGQHGITPRDSEWVKDRLYV